MVLKDDEKTKDQLIKELIELRHLVSELKKTAVPNKLSNDLQQILIEVIDNMPNGIVVEDLNNRIIYANSRIEKQTGYSHAELLEENPSIFAGERKADPIIKVIENKTNLKKNWCGEVYSKCKDGSTLLSEAEVFPIIRNGVPIACGVIQRDISKRKQFETSLRLSEERFIKVYNNSPVPMSVHSYPDGRFLYVNDSLVRFIGYSQNECIGQTSLDLNLWVNTEDFIKMSQLYEEQGVVRNIELESRMKSGEIRTGLFSAEFINFDNQRCLLNVITDITERKQFEKEIFRLDRFNLIGEMAACIGHEVRNPMTTVRGFLQILSEKEECFQQKEHFELMIEELDRANSIISEFLSLAKNKNREYERKRINSIVEALLPLIEVDAMKADKFLFVELGQTEDISLNEKEIRQLILNLVRNGLEAMPSKGTLTIKTFMENDTVVLSVQDQGIGIEHKILEKLGTPFFTTKDNGTGLGLAVCYSIANRHNAVIEIATNSRGTAFFVRFYQT